MIIFDYFYSEGAKASRILNSFGGANAVAGLHDTFQTNLAYPWRDVLNIPGVPVAAAITYAALYSNIQCPMCSNLK